MPSELNLTRTGAPIVTSETDPSARLAAARAYERLHVPALFAQWCPHVLDAVGLESGHRVLDVACGTGVLAREAVPWVAPGGRVAGIDPDSGMLAVAAELSPQVEWREATAESLPYPDASFDVVVSQFGLMFFSDRLRALREMARVLRPGGKLAVATWDRLENSEAYPIEVDLLERLVGKAAAAALRAPFVLGDVRALGALIREAGLVSVDVQTRIGSARFPTIRAMVEADLRGWLPVMGVFLDDDQIVRVLEESESVLAHYVTSEGDVVFSAPAHIATGTKP